jgi:hypothetical protein
MAWRRTSRIRCRPWLLFVEVQAGAWLRRGSFHALTREAVVETGLATFGIDGGRQRGGRHRWRRPRARPASSGPCRDRPFNELVRRASIAISAPHHGVGVRPRQAADGSDLPATLSPGMLVPGATLVDIGCGQGSRSRSSRKRAGRAARAWRPALLRLRASRA